MLHTAKLFPNKPYCPAQVST